MEERASPVRPSPPAFIESLHWNAEAMRLFTAIEILAVCFRAAETVAAELTCRAELGLRPSAPGNTHLTVRFLGEVDDDDVPSLIAALGQLRATPCELRLSAAGIFGSATGTRVVGLGVDGDQGCLDSLVGAVDDVLVDTGLKLDQQAWRPHLMLARWRDPRGSRSVARWPNEWARCELLWAIRSSQIASLSIDPTWGADRCVTSY